MRAFTLRANAAPPAVYVVGGLLRTNIVSPCCGVWVAALTEFFENHAGFAASAATAGRFFADGSILLASGCYLSFSEKLDCSGR